MKNFIYTSVVIFGAFLFLSGCYTYLSLSNGAELADVPYEPYFPPSPPEPPCCIDPAPRPIIIIIDPNPPDPKPIYERPREITQLRNGGDGRNPSNSERKR